MNRALITLFGGFTGGIAFRSFFDFGTALPIFLIVLGIVLFLYSYVLPGHLRSGLGKNIRIKVSINVGDRVRLPISVPQHF